MKILTLIKQLINYKKFNEYTLEEELLVYVLKKLVVVPKGFKYKATSPFFILNIFGLNTGNFHNSKTVCIHDWIYKHEGFEGKFKRREIDLVWFYHELLIHHGFKKWKAKVVCFYIYVFGFILWKEF